MNIKEWGARVANWKTTGSTQKSLEWHIAHLHEEVSEVFGELRDIEGRSGKPPRDAKGANPYSLITIGEKDGHPHPEGFGIELADVVLVAVFIAEVCGIDLEEQMEIKMAANEARRSA